MSTLNIMKKLFKPINVNAKYIQIPFGSKNLKLLVVKSKNHDDSKKAPGVLWIHGGGYATGMARMVYSSRAIDLVTECGAILVAPEYTLSLQAPYPQALMECHEALLYVKNNADKLGINDEQIMVGGESAGGGLTAAVCMYAFDHKTVNIAFQMPLYPMIDCFDTPSSKNNHARVWNTRRNHLAWNVYLRNIQDKNNIPCYASPSRRIDYRGLPPCYTFVGDIEPFYDETLNYVKKLQEVGIEAAVDVYKGFYHAYDMFNPSNPRVKEAINTFIQHFKYACEHYRCPQVSKRDNTEIMPNRK